MSLLSNVNYVNCVIQTILMLLNISNGLVQDVIYFVLVAMLFIPNECATRFVSPLTLGVGGMGSIFGSIFECSK